MNEINWEDKDITLVHHFGEEAIFILIGGNKSNIESSLNNNKVVGIIKAKCMNFDLSQPKQLGDNFIRILHLHLCRL